MKKLFKVTCLLTVSFFVGLAHLTTAWARTSGNNTRTVALPAIEDSTRDSLDIILSPVKSVYDSLHLDLEGLSRQAFEYAQRGWRKLKAQGKLLNTSILAIVDFSKPSSEKRLFVIDLEKYEILHHTWVAHGRNSGKETVTSFSNQPSSYKSSPGFYLTGQTYMGSNGYSLKLQGLEYGINDKAYRRAIVMHGADYVDPSYIETQGYIGRSMGCPAVPVEEAPGIINTLANGACLFIYVPHKSYSTRSRLIK
jgi:hypothetical protein